MGCIGSKYKLSKADLQFLMENTEFTKQQIKVWYSGFIVDCPSGELSKAKFIEVYQQLFPQGNAQKFCSHIFRTFDTDNSGKIDFKEFLMAINITAKGDPEKKLKWAFKMYDVDGNGEIDKGEMLQIIQSIYDLIGLNPKISDSTTLANGAAAAAATTTTTTTTTNSSSSPSAINLKVNNNGKISEGGGGGGQATTTTTTTTAASDVDKETSSSTNDNLVVENPIVRTEQIFQKMDLDRNGVISESEFINGCLQDKFLYQMLTADYSESF